ncbi:hypothetical protein [Microcoleus sp. herbarium14]|uniref:hypothetical protein n=1 Tax=Microcoleus sp. herbarium14 TaxID=3055439 RepID=UPI002FD2E6AF
MAHHNNNLVAPGHWALGIGHWALGIGDWELGIGNSFFFSYSLFIIPDLRYIRPYESVAELSDLRYIPYIARCRTSFNICHTLFFQYLQSLISQKEETQSTEYRYRVR